jgi:hypothetical protein
VSPLPPRAVVEGSADQDDEHDREANDLREVFDRLEPAGDFAKAKGFRAAGYSLWPGGRSDPRRSADRAEW